HQDCFESPDRISHYFCAAGFGDPIEMRARECIDPARESGGQRCRPSYPNDLLDLEPSALEHCTIAFCGRKVPRIDAVCAATVRFDRGVQCGAHRGAATVAAELTNESASGPKSAVDTACDCLGRGHPMEGRVREDRVERTLID